MRIPCFFVFQADVDEMQPSQDFSVNKANRDLDFSIWAIILQCINYSMGGCPQEKMKNLRNGLFSHWDLLEARTV